MPPEVTPQGSRVLVVTTDVIGERMAGPAIRSWEIAQALHPVAEVRLASTEAATLEAAPFPVIEVDDTSLRGEIEWADVLVFSGGILSMFPWISDTDTIVVADVYDPFHLEALELSKDMEPAARDEFVASYSQAINTQLARADYVLCASEKQRDFWLGQLGAIGRLNPLTYDADSSVRSLIDVVPFGVSDLEPEQARHAIKGVVPGISETDRVIIWGGGIYNWFDPLTLIRAMAQLAPEHPEVKLFFLGVAHPNPSVPKMRMATDAVRLSDELGLTGKNVFFNQEWVEYDDRINYLLDADLGVSTHLLHIETAYSFRTRILDYLWAGLPIVATAGDNFASLVRDRELGVIVPPSDPGALAHAIESTLYGDDTGRVRSNVRALAREMTWSKVLQPLVQFCTAPSHAADFPAGRSASHFNAVAESAQKKFAALEAKFEHTQELNRNLALHAEQLEHLNRQIINSRIWKLSSPVRKILGGRS